MSRLLSAWVLGTLLVAADAVSSAEPDELAANRARWEAAGMRSYEYGYRKFCECHREAPPETVVRVTEGEIDRVHHLHAGSAREVPAREGSLELYWTIDDLFALIASATERDAVVQASYDETLGYPMAVFIDYDAALIGDELDVRLTRLQAREP